MDTNTPRLRLPYLDGIRELAALYVVLFHATTMKTADHSALPQPLRFVALLLSHGHFGVVAFIVLSGFSLMLPMARARNVELPGGFRGYLRRRGRRILPAYYAAFAFSIALLAGYNTVGPRLGLGNKVDAGFSFGPVASHLFLVHNAWYGYVFRINGPMWSVATEWQIYFVFALALLPLLRRTNVLVVVVAAWILTSLPSFLVSAPHNFFWAGPWLLGSFTLGMLGAVIGFSPAWRDSPWRNRCPWGGLAVACIAAVLALVVTKQADVLRGPVEDFIESLCAMCVINACWASGGRIRSVSVGWLPRALGSPRLVQLGGFSYSLYLVQYPILLVAEGIFAKSGLSHTATVLGFLVLVVPLVVAVAWLFSRLVEHRFGRPSTMAPDPSRPVEAGCRDDRPTTALVPARASADDPDHESAPSVAPS